MKQLKTAIITGIFALLITMPTAYAGSATKVVRLNVTGMTSPTCPVLLKSAVRKINGVKNVAASLENNSATIEYDEKVTTLEKIQDTIAQQVGFGTDIKK